VSSELPAVDVATGAPRATRHAYPMDAHGRAIGPALCGAAAGAEVLAPGSLTVTEDPDCCDACRRIVRSTCELRNGVWSRKK
jgi:hypothetical protein